MKGYQITIRLESDLHEVVTVSTWEEAEEVLKSLRETMREPNCVYCFNLSKNCEQGFILVGRKIIAVHFKQLT